MIWGPNFTWGALDVELNTDFEEEGAFREPCGTQWAAVGSGPHPENLAKYFKQMFSILYRKSLVSSSKDTEYSEVQHSEYQESNLWLNFFISFFLHSIRKELEGGEV